MPDRPNWMEVADISPNLSHSTKICLHAPRGSTGWFVHLGHGQAMEARFWISHSRKKGAIRAAHWLLKAFSWMWHLSLPFTFHFKSPFRSSGGGGVQHYHVLGSRTRTHCDAGNALWKAFLFLIPRNPACSTGATTKQKLWRVCVQWVTGLTTECKLSISAANIPGAWIIIISVHSGAGTVPSME